MSLKVEINKGNYSLDTIERENAFEIRRAQKQPEAYKAYRNEWSQRPQLGHFGEYPIHLDIELSSKCNLHCPMCYTITEEFQKKVNTRFLDFELYQKIIDEIAGKVPSIRLSYRGESTLHPKFLEAIRYAKSKGIVEVSTLTNGSRLQNKKFCEDLVASGIDWVTVSADGIGEVYNKIRRPITFEKITKGLAQLLKVRAQQNSPTPVVKVQGIWPAMQENPTEYYEAYAPVSDLVAFNPLIDYMREIPLDLLLFETDFRCPMLHQRLVIGADGKFMMCTNDEDTDFPLGNAYESTVSEIWMSPGLKKVRDIHAQPNGFKQFSHCTRCYLPRKTRDDVSQVQGRPLVVRNYLSSNDFHTSIDSIALEK